MTEEKKPLPSVVEVYWNSHRKCFSVRHAGKVIAHRKTISLWKAKFVVSEKGRQRVLATGQKNVHARIAGTPANPLMGNYTLKTVTYNPYKNKNFVVNNEPIHESELVFCTTCNEKPIVEAIVCSTTMEQKRMTVGNNSFVVLEPQERI